MNFTLIATYSLFGDPGNEGHVYNAESELLWHGCTADMDGPNYAYLNELARLATCVHLCHRLRCSAGVNDQRLGRHAVPALPVAGQPGARVFRHNFAVCGDSLWESMCFDGELRSTLFITNGTTSFMGIDLLHFQPTSSQCDHGLDLHSLTTPQTRMQT